MLLFNLLQKNSKKIRTRKTFLHIFTEKNPIKNIDFLYTSIKKNQNMQIIAYHYDHNQDVNFYNLHRKMTMFIIQPLEKKDCLFTSPPFSPNNSLKKLTKECTQKKISIVQYYQDTYTRCFISLKALKHTCVSCIISRPKSKVLNVHFVRITEQRQRLHTCSFCPSIAPQ